MKFYHVCLKNSLKERQGAVRDWSVALFLVIFLSETSLACQFGGFKPHTTTYDLPLNTLRTHLPTDYNLTVFLQDTANMDSCCVDLQAMLSLNRSIGHLYRHSMDELQNLTLGVLRELKFLKDCPVDESFQCETVQWNSSHLLLNLMDHFRRFDATYEQRKCDFGRCTLYTCLSGDVETTIFHVTTNATATSMEPGVFANGTWNDPTSAVIGNTTDPTPTVTLHDLTSFTNGTSPSLTWTDGNLTSSTNGTSTVLASVNGSLAATIDQTSVNPTPSNNGNNSPLAATFCSTEPRAIISPTATQTVVIILIISVLLNIALLMCLLERRRRMAPPHMTEMEPLSLPREEVLEA
ncbi:uncharacterized protein LOC132831335 isoform X1 [Hemiscyllium ocellatum]|uniref:uncharacterized protein LOC132831335 isoform X1 n=1 Tax=Hemiscyllium ocellatum TaxID=170820 RepID=UPI002966E2E7|nr:uncharacterized protein LOC132831335 isoform X1 [Hemiscyllium ocellatum]